MVVSGDANRQSGKCEKDRMSDSPSIPLVNIPSDMVAASQL